LTPRERVQRFIEGRKILANLDPEEIMSVMVLNEDEPRSLLMADIKALLVQPQVYVSVSGGIAEYMVQRGEVDVVHIDWDNVTPESYLDPAEALVPMSHALDDSLRLPRKTAEQNLIDMKDWLEHNIIDFPTNPGWEAARELEGEIIKRLAEIRDNVPYSSHTPEGEQ